MSKYYRKNKECFDYPEQMELILTYLQEHGDITAPLLDIETLYEKFSLAVYGVKWKEVYPKSLALTEFADWLDELEDDDD